LNLKLLTKFKKGQFLSTLKHRHIAYQIKENNQSINLFISDHTDP